MSKIAAQSREAIISDFERHVSSGKVNFYQQAGIDLIIGRREGIHFYDLDGRALVNCHCNGGVFNLGHRHPRVVAAVRAALEELDIGNHHLVSEARAQLGRKLAELSPGGINRVVFGVSGGEAVDTAIKLARGHTRREVIISAIGGYHGHTGFALAAGDEQYKRPFAPLPPGFHQVPFGSLEALEETIDEHTAAVLLETIPATLGIAIPPEEYFDAVRSLCDRHGAMMIMDEVQTGLGRCGAVWAIETYGVEPDIIVTGKGLSGGIYPISATLYRDDLNPFLHANPFIHVSTFGGAELGCQAALEVLTILTEPGFLDHVHKMASVFRDGFSELEAVHAGLLVETRQRGLMMGLKMANEMCGPLMARLGLEAGLFTVYANNDPSVLQVLPPLIIQEPDAQRVLSALDHMLRRLQELVAVA